MTASFDPDRLAELEEERAFLLRSIRDIEREHEVGDVDDNDFQALRDGYVARAAVVLREIEEGRSALSVRPPRSWLRTALTVGLTLVVAVSLGLYVADSLGQRLPGQSLTGGSPDDEVALRLASARQTLGSDPGASQAAYDAVLEIEPDNVEAITYSAWLTVLEGRSSGDPTRVLEAVPLLQAAIAIDTTYADAHCFLAVATGRFLDPPMVDLAVSEGRACLALNPPSMLVNDIESLVAELEPSAG